MILKKNKIAPDSLIDGYAGRCFWQAKNADENAMVAIGCEVPGVSKVDLEASRGFLAQLGIGTGPGLHTVMSALEGGAGIGRFTRAILTGVADQVDVIEPIIKFTKCLDGIDGIRSILNIGLEEWHPDPDIKYDLIWNQGCICHLTDRQLVEYLRKCRAVLRTSSGLVIIKENISVRGFDIFDATDSTVTREDAKFLSIFREAGLSLLKSETQRGLPRMLMPVKMYALGPDETWDTKDASSSGLCVNTVNSIQ